MLVQQPMLDEMATVLVRRIKEKDACEYQA